MPEPRSRPGSDQVDRRREEVKVADRLADTAPVAVAVKSQERLSREQLLRIVEIQNEIVATRLDLVEVMRLVAARAADMTGADGGVVEMPEGEELVYRAASGATAPHVGLRLPIAGSLSGLCLRQANTLRCDDAESDERVDADKCRVVGARSLLCVPLLHHATVVGVLKVSSVKPNAFDDAHAAPLQLLSGVIAAHITNTVEFERLDVESRRNQRQAIAGLRALARAIDAKDPITRQHSDRVAHLSTAIARRLNWGEDQTHLLHEAALLHDIGKIGIPDSILLKPDRLTAEEYERVKDHAALGATIVEGVLTPQQTDWIRFHHERPDGLGYPDALTDAAIPEGAAIIALADTWDVMTISRPYSPPMNPTDALQECQKLVGRQFRATLVDILTDII